LADHLDRFELSMEKRRIRAPEDRAAIEAIPHRCVALTGFADAYVAMVASRGRPRSDRSCWRPPAKETAPARGRAEAAISTPDAIGGKHPVP